MAYQSYGIAYLPKDLSDYFFCVPPGVDIGRLSPKVAVSMSPEKRKKEPKLGLHWLPNVQVPGYYLTIDGANNPFFGRDTRLPAIAEGL